MAKISIYTATSYRAIQSAEECLLAKYQFPEKYKSPYEQIEWLKKIVKEVKVANSDVSIVTFSPYILNYINVLLAKGDINADDIDVIEFDIREEENILDEYNRKMIDDKGNWVIDTFSFSEPINLTLNEWLKYAKQ